MAIRSEAWISILCIGLEVVSRLVSDDQALRRDSVAHETESRDGFRGVIGVRL